MISLDDHRWPDLGHRNWSPGQRPGDDPTVPFVPDELRLLRADPADRERFGDLWPYLCSEDTAWPAAYAAVPHLAELAGLLPAASRARDDYLYVTGYIVMCSGDFGDTPDDLPADIAAAYRQALPRALTLLTETLAAGHGGMDTRYLLAATAALKGHPRLGELLNQLDALAECEECGEPQSLLDGLE